MKYVTWFDFSRCQPWHLLNASLPRLISQDEQSGWINGRTALSEVEGVVGWYGVQGWFLPCHFGAGVFQRNSS